MPGRPVSYRFGPYEVDASRNELRKFDTRLKIERKPWQLLIALVEHAGSVVTRAELHRSLWLDDVFVDFDRGLTVAVTKLRAILNDSADNPKYIETISGEGYRFTGKVEQVIAPLTSVPAPDQGSVSLPLVAPLEEGQTTALVGASQTGTVFGTRTLLIAAVLIICLAGLVLGTLTWSRKRPQPLDVVASKRMLVVLPFQNLSGDPGQEYLADGVTEELSERLGNMDPQHLGVIGRTSAMAYKGSKRTITEIGKDLSVGYVLEGSIRRNGEKLRVTAQLVQVSDQTHVWAQDYDRDVSDVLQVEDELASDIAQQVGVTMAVGQPPKPLYPHSPNRDAHEDYLLAQYYWNQRTPEGWAAAEQHFRSATQKDPFYAAAYAGLAETGPMPEALAAARKAVELDPTSGEAYAALGWVKFYQELDVKGAGDALKSAIQLDPNFATAHHTYSAFLQVRGRSEDAIREEQEAVTLDPLFHIARITLAAMLWHAGDHNGATEQLNTVLAIAPQFPKAHEVLAGIYLERGMCREAFHEFELSEKFGGFKEPDLLGYAYGRCGKKEAALRMLSDLEGLEQRSPSGRSSFSLALVETGLGNRDAAIGWLEKAYRQHGDDGLLSLKVDPVFDPLRSDPRFQEIVRGMNFPP